MMTIIHIYVNLLNMGLRGVTENMKTGEQVISPSLIIIKTIA